MSDTKNLADELRKLGANVVVAGEDVVIGPPKNGNRQCGSCTLCCKLVPVEELGKRANTRCTHQRHTGCAIYKDRPLSCKLWSCAWLLNNDMDDQLRPERSHVVVAMDLETIWARDNDTGERIPIHAVEIWCDPAFKDAHRHPAIRRFMERRGRQGLAIIIRYSSSEGFTIFPPRFPGEPWREIESTVIPEAEAREIKRHDREMKWRLRSSLPALTPPPDDGASSEPDPANSPTPI